MPESAAVFPADSSVLEDVHPYVRALLNILEDSASEQQLLQQTQSAVLNILEDSASEAGLLHQTQSVTLNILEDSASERELLHEAQPAMLNILEDSSSEQQLLQQAQSAVLNILEDFASEAVLLHQMQSVTLNILEDSASERELLHEAQPAMLNILEDSSSEQQLLQQAQSAVLNILEDSASEAGLLHQTQSVTLNILEDSASERELLHEAQRAVLNILDDSAAERGTLHYTQSAMLNILEDVASDKSHLEETRKAALNILEDLAVEKQQLNERTLELEAANQELNAFAHSVSHDLRAPLRGIDGWSMALIEDYAGTLDDSAREYLDRIRSETQRMGRLIDDLLKLSRVTRTEMQRHPVDVSAMVRTIANRLSEASPKREIKFAIEAGMTAIADGPLLEVALTNLLDNAVKFTSRLPRARIEIGRTEDQRVPTFFVRDNGAGFDMAHAEMLFGTFKRLHKATEFPGTGIGLATVQRVIHRHGGQVWAEAKVDEGATFYFTLGPSNEQSSVRLTSEENREKALSPFQELS